MGHDAAHASGGPTLESKAQSGKTHPPAREVALLSSLLAERGYQSNNNNCIYYSKRSSDLRTPPIYSQFPCSAVLLFSQLLVLTSGISSQRVFRAIFFDSVD